MIKESKTDRGLLKYLLIYTIAFIALCIIGFFIGTYLLSYFQNENTSKSIFAQKWVTETYGNYGLTLETPFRLEENKVTVPANLKDVVDNIESFTYPKKRGFKIRVNSIQYKPVVRAVNLQGAANSSVAEIKRRKGVTDLNYTEEIVMISNLQGLKQNGSYKQDGIPYEFINVVLGDGLHLWQITFTYNQKDVNGKKAAERVYKSLDIYKVNPV